MDRAASFTRRQMLLAGAAALPSWILSSRAEAAFAALAAPPGGQSAPAPSQKTKTKVIETQWIEMPDGAKLAARIFLPEDAGQHPVGAVFEYIPYRLRDWYRIADNYTGHRLAERGFAFVRVDIRGSGDSDGLIAGEYMEPEQHDAVSIIRWIARQPWCNGSVGMRGASWGAFSALHAAEAAPEELKAIISVCGSENRYLEDSHYLGGAILMDNTVWGAMFDNCCASPPDPEIVGERWRSMWRERLQAAIPQATTWISHQRYDSFWKYGTYSDYSKIKCAVYSVDGLVDPYIDSPARLMSHLKCPRKALIGPWAHAAPGGQPGPSLDWPSEEARWWDEWLNKKETGIVQQPVLQESLFQEPMLRAYMAYASAARQYPEPTPGRWVAEPIWPSPNVSGVPFYLTKHGLARRPSGGETRIEYAARQTVGLKTIWWVPTALDQELPLEQSDDDRLSLLFDSSPLKAPLEILGNPVAKIRVRADQPVAKLVIRLTEVDPTGKSWLVSYGALNLTHRAGLNTDALRGVGLDMEAHEHPKPLVPGRDYDVEFPLYFTARRFSQGSRIRVAVSETLWPLMWPSPRPVTLEITTGQSQIVLPVRAKGDPRLDAMPIAPLPKRPAGRNQAKASGGSNDAGEKGRNIEIQGPAERRQVRLVQDDPYGKMHLDEINTDLEVFLISIDHRITEGDPNSSVWSGACSCAWSRPEWKVETRATFKMTSTPEEFVIEEGLRATENGQVVADRNWSNRIKRDLV